MGCYRNFSAVPVRFFGIIYCDENCRCSVPLSENGFEDVFDPWLLRDRYSTICFGLLSRLDWY